MAISQVKSKGFLMMEELRGQIAEQAPRPAGGVRPSPTTSKIKTSEVEKAISGKKVTADVGIKSILEAIQDMGGGGLGAVSAGKAVQTLAAPSTTPGPWASGMLLAINTGPAWTEADFTNGQAAKSL